MSEQFKTWDESELRMFMEQCRDVILKEEGYEILVTLAQNYGAKLQDIEWAIDDAITLLSGERKDVRRQHTTKNVARGAFTGAFIGSFPVFLAGTLAGYMGARLTRPEKEKNIQDSLKKLRTAKAWVKSHSDALPKTS